MTSSGFTKGVHKVGEGIFAYIQPDGAWGWNNAGLVLGKDTALAVDTLFDLALTREMLAAYETVLPRGIAIEQLVITHANGDHWFGAELFEGARVIATEACAKEMEEAPPKMLAELMEAAPALGDLGAYFLHCFDAFAFAGIQPVFPTRTFDQSLSLDVGGKAVELLDVGPAHTRSDLLVHLPEEKVLFTGDLLFIGGTPIMWAGPVENWVGALDYMLDLDVEVIVPGHGPLTDKKGVEQVRAYWLDLTQEAKKSYDKGLDVMAAAREMDLPAYASWTDPERILINLTTLYKEFSGDDSPPNVVELFTAMAQFHKG